MSGARFDVYSNPGAASRTTPYLLDVQSDLLDELDSRMVNPLRKVAHFPDVIIPARLMPVFSVDGGEYLLETPKKGAVPQRVLKSPVASLADQQSRITDALNFLYQGC